MLARHHIMEYINDTVDTSVIKLRVVSKLAVYHYIFQWKELTYLLTYLAITICYRSWPQLICGAIRHELLQLGANFGYPAFLDSHQPVWPNAGEAVLVSDNHHLAQIRRLYELGWSYPYERHDPAIEDVVF